MNKQQRIIKVGELWAQMKSTKEIAKELKLAETIVNSDIKEIKELNEIQESNNYKNIKKINYKAIWGIGLILLSLYFIYLMPTSFVLENSLNTLNNKTINDENPLKVHEIHKLCDRSSMGNRLTLNTGSACDKYEPLYYFFLVGLIIGIILFTVGLILSSLLTKY